MGSPFTRPRRSGIASPGGDTPGASIGDANTRVQIGADARLLVPTLDGPRDTPVDGSITDTPGLQPMVGYVVIRGIGRDGFGTVSSVTVDGRPVAAADMGVTTVGYERDDLGAVRQVPGVILRVQPGNRRVRVSVSERRLPGPTVREYGGAVEGNVETATSRLSWSGPLLSYPADSINPLFVEWDQMPIAGVGAVKVNGMPPGAGIRLDADANTITPDPSGRWGYWAGWVSGNPASGIGLIRGIPVGRHRLKIIGTNGSVKSFDVDVPESPGGGSEFNLASGAYPTTMRLASIDYASAPYDAGRGPPTSQGTEGEGAPFTLDVSPVDITADTGGAVEVQYTVATARTDSTGTPQRVTLRVSDPSTGGGLAARGLTARFGSTTINAGESTTLTITGPAVSTPSTARFLVQAEGPGAPSAPILREIVFAAPRADNTSSSEDDSTLSMPVILAAVAVVAGGAWLLLRSPRSNPARRRRGRR